jgi:hypothetical protein
MLVRGLRVISWAHFYLSTAEWFSYTEAKAVELGKKYDKWPRYFLDIFFQGGAHMVNHQDKTNPYNAFKNEKATQRRNGKKLFIFDIFLP